MSLALPIRCRACPGLIRDPGHASRTAGWSIRNRCRELTCTGLPVALGSGCRPVKDDPMTASRRFRYGSALVAVSLVLTGCSAAMTSTPASERSAGIRDAHGVEWPLKFKSHYFGAACFNTQSCIVLYRDFPHGATNERPSPSVESTGRSLDQLLVASRGPIPNFPPPAKVTWSSKDGASHEAHIDIAQIFRDELIRHNLTREDIPDSTLASDHSPGIILEVNDRTINVYMRAHISTKELQEPGNRYSDFRDDLIKVFSRSY